MTIKELIDKLNSYDHNLKITINDSKDLVWYNTEDPKFELLNCRDWEDNNDSEDQFLNIDLANCQIR